MPVKSNMNDIVHAFSKIHGLSHLKRQGPSLFAGISPTKISSITNHSYMVSVVALLLRNHMPQNYRFDKIYEYIITHDWGEIEVNDLPVSSPSYAQYFNGNIRELFHNAEAKVLEEFMDNHGIENRFLDLTEDESKYCNYCDNLSHLFEILYIKESGNIHGWLDKMFIVRVEELKKFNYEFNLELLNSLWQEYEKLR